MSDPVRQKIEDAFSILVGRTPETAELDDLGAYVRSADLTDAQLLAVLAGRADVVLDTLDRAQELHLFALHLARVRLIATVLPAAARIVDLGGANAPLCDCGYRHRFDELTIVDLPPADRHEAFADRVMEARQTPQGPVSILYSDMSDLHAIPDHSVDLVWSGQSIEHIERDEAQRVYREVTRVLRPEGWFCLDTPNALLTRLHAPDQFIHPDHKFEYTPEELTGDLRRAGLRVEQSLGVCEMPLTIAAGSIDYRDFLVGAGISTAVDRCYIQYHACRVGPTEPAGSPPEHRTELHRRIEALPAAIASVPLAPDASRLPGGSLAHRLVRRATARQYDQVGRQMQRLAEEVRACLLELMDLGAPPSDRSGSPE